MPSGASTTSASSLPKNWDDLALMWWCKPADNCVIWPLLVFSSCRKPWKWLLLPRTTSLKTKWLREWWKANACSSKKVSRPRKPAHGLLAVSSVESMAITALASRRWRWLPTNGQTANRLLRLISTTWGRFMATKNNGKTIKAKRLKPRSPVRMLSYNRAKTTLGVHSVLTTCLSLWEV